ncbi:uncharacterized protein LOC124774838 [Schistocerca piceifrons]|uniref:uncharacterized protein LOC124774838 n=1 Tax=Schistocerca piceifrons TaxID=274613 RepID=UPI001F5EC3A4|nr:uncharacterized protein LOC124774838 [Schistocerca piceifrons]
MGSKTASKTGKGSGKQNSGRMPTAKGQQRQKEKDSQEQEVVHRTDLSVLRQPINISVRRVCDIVKMYQTCTSELKQLLDNEVEIVYECKVCRNLFRSMANIISHKRVYCRQQYSEAYYSFNKRHTMDDYTVIIQPEPVVTASSEKESWSTSDKAPSHESNNEVVALRDIKATVPRIVSSSKPKKDLTQIIEELSDKKGIKNFKETVAHYSASSLYEDINRSLISRAQQRKQHAIHLEPTGSSSGVFQTKLHATTSTTIQAENIDLMKAQVIELQQMVRETEAVLDEEGRIVQIKGSCNGPAASPSKETTAVLSPTNSTPETKDTHVCSQCGSRFSTRKTLAHHMKSLHTAYRLCYPCPCCKNTFSNNWSVYRHLYKVHRKTTAQVRKLRPQIQSKAFKREIGVEKLCSDSSSTDKVPPTEQEAARKEQNRIDQENKEWMDNFEDDQELQRCGGCGRRFERRAALTSHSQICQKRIAARKIKVPNMTQPSSEKSAPKSGNTDATKPVTSNRENESKAEAVPVSENVQRARHSSGSNWSDAPKKEVLGKRIEIQIRRDYCKFGSNIPSSSQQQSNNFSRSVSPESIPNISPPVKDETESLLSEAEVDDENDTDFSKKRHYVSRLDATESQITDTDKLETNPSEASQGNTANSPVETHKRSATARSALRSKRRLASIDKELPQNCALKKRRATVDEVSDKEGSASETNENSEYHENIKHRAQRSSSVEHFSPIMERKMHSLINLKRLQCLPCQKKFNKLPNLRRHVAVHIGWNRYRCPICNYKCFAKCDCVHHVIKVHGNDRSEALDMVQLIESQGSDTSSNDKSPVLSSAAKTGKIKKEATVDTNFNRDLTEADAECETLATTNGVSVSYIIDDADPQSCSTEEDRIQVFLFDGESANKDSDLADPNSPLNCLGDADLDDSEVSYIVPEGEPVIHSLENNCNETVLNFIDENFHTQAPSINGDREDDRDQEDQPETDYSRSDFENDSDVPRSPGSTASTDSKKNALRRMVMEVIFGSASASQMEPQLAVSNGFRSSPDSPDDDSQDSREDSMEGSTGNGQEGMPEGDRVGSPRGDRDGSLDDLPEDGPQENSVCPEDAPEGSSDERVTLPEEEQAGEMAVVHSDSSSQCSNRSGVERRKQPVRTRMFVRRDDFIYDGPSGSGATVSKKVVKSQSQQQVDDSAVDRVPKMTLVRVGGSVSSTETSSASSTSAWRTSIMAVTENRTAANTSRTSVNLPPRKAAKVSESLEKNSLK